MLTVIGLLLLLATIGWLFQRQNGIDVHGRGCIGLVCYCSLVEAEGLWEGTHPSQQMRLAVAVISAPEQLRRRQVRKYHFSWSSFIRTINKRLFGTHGQIVLPMSPGENFQTKLSSRFADFLSEL